MYFLPSHRRGRAAENVRSRTRQRFAAYLGRADVFAGEVRSLFLVHAGQEDRASALSGRISALADTGSHQPYHLIRHLESQSGPK